MDELVSNDAYSNWFEPIVEAVVDSFTLLSVLGDSIVGVDDEAATCTWAGGSAA